jgi:hypothetical protein
VIFEVRLECVAQEYMGGFVEESLSRQLRNWIDRYFSSASVALTDSGWLREGNLCDVEILQCQAGVPIRQWREFNVWPFGL